ncbi:PEP-CTERM sorting domain-containing protein [Ideonella sp. DXS22W]|uniref:PEP-CTERM sorting domain-containing protein n=1 Tax=Pseudaquabacterium inlustre TaxID=2984192 RepID=A0ABU9CMS7_9BURK
MPMSLSIVTRENTLKLAINLVSARIVSQTAAITLFGAFSANAALVTTTASTSTGLSVAALQDTDTGLTWLTPTATLGMTFAQAASGVWAQSGFRHATGAEFLALLGHAGIDPALGTTPPLPYLSVTFSGSQAQAVRELIGTLGATNIVAPPSAGNPFGQQDLYAVLADHGSRGVGTAPGNSEVYLSGFSAGAVVRVTDYTWADGNADAYVGHLLVSAPVPEPASWAMLMAGALVLAGAARRRQR